MVGVENPGEESLGTEPYTVVSTFGFSVGSGVAGDTGKWGECLER